MSTEQSSSSAWTNLHQAAGFLPLLSGDDLDAFTEDIKANGLLQPLRLWRETEDSELVLLDGRNRLAALHIRALHQNWTEGRGKGGEEVYIAHAVIALAIAKKSRCTDWAVLHHLSDHVERREVPDEALDMHTHRGRRMGRDRRHFMEEGSQLRDWTGSLEDLEAGYCEKVEQLIDHDPVPTNPWGSQSPRGDSTQLELGGES